MIGLILAWSLAVFAMGIPFVLVGLIVVSVKSGRKMRDLRDDENAIESKIIKNHIAWQQIVFLPWLHLTKAFASFALIAASLLVILELREYFMSVIQMGSPNFVSLFTFEAREALLFLATGIVLSAFHLLIFFVFSFLLKKRILVLRLLDTKKAP